MLGSFYVALINIIICSLLSYLIAPLVKKIGANYKIVDIPNNRKVHTKPIVRIGGLSIFLIFFLYFFIYKIFIDFNIISTEILYPFYSILAGAFLFFIIGLHDDIYKSSPFFRLALQFLIAFVLTHYGLNFGSLNLSLPFFGNFNIVLPSILNCIFSSFWIVGITNALNWLDGIDGLAAGYSSILAFGLCLFMIINGNPVGILFFSIILGSVFGFLLRNFKPAFYIMGDCGSNFLGFCLSTSALIFLKDQTLNSINFVSLIILFSLPILDMLTVILGRFLNGKSIFLPDKTHIHHRLLNINLEYKNVIFLLYLYSTFSVLLGIFFLNNTYK